MVFTDKIIKEICITEKASELSSNLNKYVFEVYKSANRTEIAKAIEKMFDVKVSRVNVLNKKGKKKSSRTRAGKGGRTSDVKRAIISLKEGDKIEIV